MKKKQLLHSISRGSSDHTVVFLHGFLASAKYWRRPQQELAHTHRTIAVDLLGFGRSPKPRNSEYTYQEHIQAIKDTLEMHGVSKPVTLVGHSMGALLALRFAVDHPELVANVKLFNPPLFFDQQQARQNLSSTGKLYRFILYSKWRRWFWRSARLFPIFYIAGDSSQKGHLGMMRHSHYSRELSLHNIIEKQSAFDDLQRLQKPAHLIVSRYDRYAYQQNLALYDLPSNIEILFKESDHHFPIHNPQESVDIIRS